MSEMDEEIIEEFVTESMDGLDELEPLIVGLTPQGANREDLDAIFRHLHSIKGTASFVNLPILTRVAHAAENLLDALRHGEIEVNSPRIDLMCEAVDIIRTALERLSQGISEDSYADSAKELTQRLNAETQLGDEPSVKNITLSPRSEAAPSSKKGDSAVRQSPMPPPSESMDGPSSTLVAMLMPDLVDKFCTESEEQLSNIELTLLAWESQTATTEMLAESFRDMHSLKGNCGIMGLADMEEITHHLESTFLEWSEGKSAPQQAQVTTILSTLDVLRQSMQNLTTNRGEIREKERLLQALFSAASSSASRAPESMAERDEEPPSGEEFLVENEGTAVEVNASSAQGESPPKVKKSRTVNSVDEPETTLGVERVSNSIRVDTRKLDELMNLVGELIIAETTVTHNPDLEGHEFENFQKAALNLNRITRQLQDVTMQARMVPIETTFRKMIRLVRDVSKKQQKEVLLSTEGAETEVDKSVIETIADPLVHLIRNGIDHGLEDSPGRKAAGKPTTGNLKLSAHHQGGEVWISITDDGRGIDPDKILASAIKKKVAEPDRTYTRDEILQMIFAPGFSTAAAITDISGRGVGMDVVKRNVERVNGRIDVDTKVGRGTTFTLRIPLTLAIIEGMLVRVGKSFYILPLLSIKESVKATSESLTVLSDGQELLKLREEHYPITRLSDLCPSDSEGLSVDDGILVLVESEGHQACILVDEVVGQRQTVIKPLPDYLKGIRSLGGCSILHNGAISLILDVDALVRNSRKQEEAAA